MIGDAEIWQSGEGGWGWGGLGWAIIAESLNPPQLAETLVRPPDPVNYIIIIINCLHTWNLPHRPSHRNWNTLNTFQTKFGLFITVKGNTIVQIIFDIFIKVKFPKHQMYINHIMSFYLYANFTIRYIPNDLANDLYPISAMNNISKWRICGVIGAKLGTYKVSTLQTARWEGGKEGVLNSDVMSTFASLQYVKEPKLRHWTDRKNSQNV